MRNGKLDQTELKLTFSSWHDVLREIGIFNEEGDVRVAAKGKR